MSWGCLSSPGTGIVPEALSIGGPGVEAVMTCPVLGFNAKFQGKVFCLLPCPMPNEWSLVTLLCLRLGSVGEGSPLKT